MVQRITHGKAGVYAGIVGIEFDGAPEADHRLFEFLAAQLVAEQQLTTSQEKVVGIHILGAATGYPHFFTLVQLDFQRRYDLLRKFILHSENIGEIAIEAVSPDMSAAHGVDQLAGHAHPIAGLAHAAFQYVADTELAADLLHVDRLALVGKTRIARD